MNDNEQTTIDYFQTVAKRRLEFIRNLFVNEPNAGAHVFRSHMESANIWISESIEDWAVLYIKGNVCIQYVVDKMTDCHWVMPTPRVETILSQLALNQITVNEAFTAIEPYLNNQ